MLGRSRHEVLDAFILGFARFQVGCSARFNNLQHVHPKDLIHTSNTVELKAWQTKTVSAARINREVQLHGNPLVDYLGGHGPATGIRGGIPGHGLLAPDSEQRLRRADPETFSTPERALRWLKDALLRRGVTPGLVKRPRWWPHLWKPRCPRP